MHAYAASWREDRGVQAHQLRKQDLKPYQRVLVHKRFFVPTGVLHSSRFFNKNALLSIMRKRFPDDVKWSCNPQSVLLHKVAVCNPIGNLRAK